MTPDAERLMGYCARVSNPANQDNPDVTKLLRSCIKRGHWSVFEMADMCIEIQTTRGISAQIIRHRSFHFQEFCVTGDTRITTIMPANRLPNYIPISKLYERQKWKNYAGIHVRVFDEATGRFSAAPLSEVFATGSKPVFEVELVDGKRVSCTKEHRFLTQTGFRPLEEIVGLELVGERAVMSRVGFVATNGMRCDVANSQRLYERHDRKRGLPGSPKGWLVPRWTQIAKIRFLGMHETYDLEVDHGSHNYVANKIVVHNSQRYAPVQKIETVQPRRQDLKNRQSSHDDLPEETLAWFADAQKTHFGEAQTLYEQALEKGIAKESARFLLPLAAGTTIYMKGSVRDWVHYINLRSDPGTQLEHREIALGCKAIFVEQFPILAEALGWLEPAVSPNGSNS
ncbi:MAG: hypothetical protein NVS1B14_07160 [Vulcanimicrobiaceae bacterium]